MEGAVTGGVEYLIQTYGLAGLVIIALCVVVWRLGKRDETRQTKLEALQEKRVEEAKESTNALNANTDAMDRLAELIRDRLRPLP